MSLPMIGTSLSKAILSVYGRADGGPAVRVEYVWWKRPPEEIATIRGLNRRLPMAAAAVVFITGREGDGHAARTVDIHSGEVLTAVTGARDPVKFQAPPRLVVR
jgi:hypothetical protein